MTPTPSPDDVEELDQADEDELEELLSSMAEALEDIALPIADDDYDELEGHADEAHLPDVDEVDELADEEDPDA